MKVQVQPRELSGRLRATDDEVAMADCAATPRLFGAETFGVDLRRSAAYLDEPSATPWLQKTARGFDNLPMPGEARHLLADVTGGPR